jgi:hypothetical protein
MLRYKMAFSRATALLGLALGVATCMGAAQTKTKPLFTDYPPYLCVGGGFVAMAGIGDRDPLLVIPIDVNGVEAPQTIAQGDAIIGMRCAAHRIEILVQDYKSGHPIKFLYTVQWHSQSPTTIHEDQREDIYVPRIGPEPPAVDFLEWGVNRAGGWTTGDWYIWVPQVVDRPNNRYEVHFVHTQTRHRGGGATSKLVVDLLEETLDRKVTKTLSLVNIVADSD